VTNPGPQSLHKRYEKRKRLVFDKGGFAEIQPILSSHVSNYEWELYTSANQTHHINTLPYPQAHSVISKTEYQKHRERERERETLIISFTHTNPILSSHFTLRNRSKQTVKGA
jgi:hypothetical protein